ncbi:MAG: superoxide dismutase family protein [Bdellovibrionota bacterium]|nr:MAG: superoxide dismutase family protein [Bdellovibrionota bacterium]
MTDTLLSRFPFLLALLLGASPLAAAALTPAKKVASAELKPTQGNSVQGRVTFIALEEGAVQVEALVSGLTPGKHGFHIHEVGDCSSADGSSAGPHFNPHGSAHGGPQSKERHAGDLGNLVADQDGIAKLSLAQVQLSLTGEHSILGRSIIVHAAADDLSTQPTGNSGARQACGVISMAP